MRRAWICLVAGIGLLLLLSGCYERGHDYFVKRGKSDYEWTDRQAEAAWDYALKTKYLEKNEDGTYSVDTSVVSMEDAWIVVDEILKDIDFVLSPDRSASWRALLIGLPTLREGFEREEQKWLYIRSQLGKVLVYQDFLELLGKTMPAAEKAYKIEYLLPENTNFVYEPDYLRKAKEDGRLKKVEEGLYYVWTPFGYRVPDPAHRGEANAYIWQPKTQGYWVVSYVIDNGQECDELKADFAEIYRAKVAEGKILTEKEPCVRAYRKLSGDMLRVIIIDWDHEGEPGHGTPDEVQSVYAKTGWALVSEKEELFERLARPREEMAAAERAYILKPLDLKIVRVGSVEEYRGEFKEDGWEVPYEYKNQYESNWIAKIIEEDLPEDYPWKRIAYVVKVWDSTVWEYYLPKPEYAADMEVLVASVKNVVCQPVGGAKTEVSADAVKGELYKIIYKDGDVWVELVDLDGVGVLQYKIVGVPSPAESSTTYTRPQYGY